MTFRLDESNGSALTLNEGNRRTEHIENTFEGFKFGHRRFRRRYRPKFGLVALNQVFGLESLHIL